MVIDRTAVAVCALEDKRMFDGGRNRTLLWICDSLRANQRRATGPGFPAALGMVSGSAYEARCRLGVPGWCLGGREDRWGRSARHPASAFAWIQQRAQRSCVR